MRTYPVEMQLLAAPARLLGEITRQLATDPMNARLQILEAAASAHGGFSLPAYHQAAKILPVTATAWLEQAGLRLLHSLAAIPIPAPLAFSALAREPLSEARQRSTGAYDTDFRLARHMASQAAPFLKERSRMIDPGCGTGMLLTATTLATCGDDRQKVAAWLANGVYGADLSPNAQRGALLSLASMTDDLTAIRSLAGHLYCQDSLLAENNVWRDLMTRGFNLVIGNPPWEKLKLSRHEFLQAQGEDRHYDATYHRLVEADYFAEKLRVQHYARRLAQSYACIGAGGPDLYMAFLELFLRLTQPGGHLSVLLPASLIRTQGAQALRRHLFETTDQLCIEILENRARFFAIDTCFKFMRVSSIKRSVTARHVPAPTIRLIHAKGTAQGVTPCGETLIERETLIRLRPDLTLPEVRSGQEWRIFRIMTENGVAWIEAAGWRADIAREINMTRDRHLFLNTPSPGGPAPGGGPHGAPAPLRRQSLCDGKRQARHLAMPSRRTKPHRAAILACARLAC